MAGKGDRPRAVDGPRYRDNYERIFGMNEGTRCMLEEFRDNGQGCINPVLLRSAVGELLAREEQLNALMLAAEMIEMDVADTLHDMECDGDEDVVNNYRSFLEKVKACR